MKSGNLHLKTTFVVVATLLLGVIFGVILSNTLMKRQDERLRTLVEPGRFLSFHMGMVDPTDEQQKLIEPIFHKYHDSLMKLRQEQAGEMSAILDEMYQELSAVLDEEQMAKLREGVGPYRFVVRRRGAEGDTTAGRRLGILGPDGPRMAIRSPDGPRMITRSPDDTRGRMLFRSPEAVYHGDGSVMQMISGLIQMVRNDFDLGEDQERRLDELYEKLQRDIQPKEREMSETMREFHREAMREVDREIRNILSDEQYEAYRRQAPRP